MHKIPMTYKITATAILVVLVLVFLLGRSSKKEGDSGDKEDEREDKDARGAVADEARRLGISVDASLVQRHGRGLVTAFGWGMGPFGSDALSEDEDAITAIVLLYTSRTYPLLAIAYYEISRRDLTTDIFTYVDDDNISRMTHILPS